MFKRPTILVKNIEGVRLHSVKDKSPKSFVTSFPSLESITAEELGYSETTKAFGHQTYHLQRTKYKLLPIYTDYKQGHPWTEIRKIQGDIVQLKRDLIKTLPPLKDQIRIYEASKKIRIKGNYRDTLHKIFESIF